MVLVFEGESNLLQNLAWLAAAGSLILSLVSYLSQQILNRQQRQLELRWRQAEAGKKLIDEMLSDENALAAMKMLDWNDVKFEIAPGNFQSVWEKDYLQALRIENLNFTDKEMFIRNCFDSLFYYAAMIEHYLKSNLIVFEDVAFPLDYYYKTMRRHKKVFDEFLNH